MLTLNDICLQITDGSHFSPEDKGTGYPMLSVKDMRDDHFDLSDCKYVDEEDYQKLLANGCKPLLNDVVLAKDGSYLKTAFTIKEEQDIALLSSIAILRPDLNVVVPDYLSYFLKSKPVYRTVSLNYISGTALKRIILKGIKKIPVELPALKEQQNRVDLLNSVQNIIKMRMQELHYLNELIKARFVELFGDMTANPNGWEVVPLGKVCDVRDGTHDSPKYFTEGYPLVTSKNVTSGKIDFSDCSLICEEDYKKINERSKVDFGDILMPMIGTVGKPVIVDVDAEFAIKNVALIKFYEDSQVTNIFVKALLQSDYFDRAVISKIRGGTQKFIALGDIRKLEICLPPMSVQEEFAIFVSQTDKSKFMNSKCLIAL